MHIKQNNAVLELMTLTQLSAPIFRNEQYAIFSYYFAMYLREISDEKNLINNVYNFSDNATTLGEQYLRKCESIVHALSTIYQEQSEHGTNFYGNPTTFCDYDGTYGSYQVQNGM